ncbi:MAG: YciI family protein [Chloroflexi bacterium]|nr:YciI family protein [Chloroflexota bacterium]MCI0577559.1 YciI family protein [Chloroflexota bacterium]MCI0646221.1 YciI family protein [Chloroflexota bacterium]MCI0732074.1 YciI family protein [Chloroflexota bacterium]
MKFALLIYEDEKYYQEATPADWEAAMIAHNRFGAEATERGMDPSSEAHQPTAAARTVRFQGSKSVLVTDGPFAETKEQLGGFYILDCKDIDEALEMARKLPVLEGAVEVRPVMVFG